MTKKMISFVLLLSMGSSNEEEAEPVLNLFNFFKNVLGSKNRLHTIAATRLAVINQMIKTEAELAELYTKMKLPVHLAGEDFKKNRALLKRAFALGQKIAGNK